MGLEEKRHDINKTQSQGAHTEMSLARQCFKDPVVPNSTLSKKQTSTTTSTTTYLRRLLLGPIEGAVQHLVVLALAQPRKQTAQVLVVGRLEKVQPTHVAQVGGKLFGVAVAEHLDRGGLLRLADLRVALLERLRLQALPGQRAAQEVHEHVPDCFEIVATTLFWVGENQSELGPSQ